MAEPVWQGASEASREMPRHSSRGAGAARRDAVSRAQREQTKSETNLIKLIKLINYFNLY